MKDKILITGITGFVGGNLKEYLKETCTCIGVSRKENLQNDIISYKNISKNNFDNTFAFIHLAGKAHDLKNTSKEEEYFEVNRDLTIKLFDQFLESDCEKFIYISSVKAVKDVVKGILTEEDIPNPITPYGKSKLEAEKYILSKKIPVDKKVYILRPCMIHGPNNKGNLNLLYSMITKRIPYPLGKYQNKRSYTSIDNLCFIIKQLIEKNIDSGVYNIADDNPLSTKEVVKLIGEVKEISTKIINIPKEIIKMIAKIGDFIPIPLNSHNLVKLTESYVVSNGKIKRAIGKKLPLSTIKGLEKTIKSFN